MRSSCRIISCWVALPPPWNFAISTSANYLSKEFI